MTWALLALFAGAIVALVQEIRVRAVQERLDTSLAAEKDAEARVKQADRRLDALRWDYAHAIKTIRACPGDPGPLLDELLLDPWLGRPAGSPVLPAPGVGGGAGHALS